ncbi:hypothetical protein WG908_15950 [Sphingobium sp. AN641]|uniref:hypothetical protein n=1 Tax=Sphingobium sp. AN641 TaxID=3133443 RepID=UPI0030C446A0
MASRLKGIVDDIRQKVVEEPTYGRAVTPRAQSITIGAPGEKSPGEGLGWFQENFGPEKSQQAAPSRDIHGNEHGIEH